MPPGRRDCASNRPCTAKGPQTGVDTSAASTSSPARASAQWTHRVRREIRLRDRDSVHASSFRPYVATRLCALHWRARNCAVRAKHATVAEFRTQHRSAASTVVEVDTGIGGHRFRRHVSALGARQLAAHDRRCALRGGHRAVVSGETSSTVGGLEAGVFICDPRCVAGECLQTAARVRVADAER